MKVQAEQQKIFELSMFSSYGFIAYWSLVSVTCRAKYMFIWEPWVVVMVMVMENAAAVTEDRKHLGTGVDWRVTKPAQDFTKVLSLAFSQV